MRVELPPAHALFDDRPEYRLYCLRSIAVVDKYSLIRRAIIDKDIVVATYHGYAREMCPHAIGYKKGRQKALLYQFAGGSSSGLGSIGSPDNWRCVFIDELENVSVQPNRGSWHTADQARRQTCIDEVDVEIT